MLLAGDVGGTKTVLGLFGTERGPRAPLVEREYRSRGYPGLAAIISEFLSDVGGSIDRACIGVAGPVVQGRAHITNLGWDLAEPDLANTLGIEQLRLVNDLQAIGYAIPSLGDSDLHTLSAGTPDPGGAVAIVAPGTGLGEAFLTPAGDGLASHPSEGGHADFAPNTPLQVELVQYVMQRYGHVSRERVCSGSGIPNLYAFLRDSGRYDEPAWLAERLAKAADPTPVISEHAFGARRQCDICAATMDLFTSILGAEAGNLALTVLATGGVYLAGGVPRRVLPALQRDTFLHAFRSKGRVSQFMERFPVHVITNNRTALMGAARRGLALSSGTRA
jgi:glucokinase